MRCVSKSGPRRVDDYVRYVRLVADRAVEKHFGTESRRAPRATRPSVAEAAVSHAKDSIGTAGLDARTSRTRDSSRRAKLTMSAQPAAPPPRNPAALAEAQSASEMFDVMHPPDPDFDIYKDKGVPTGETKPRGLVHRDRDWHRSVHVWLVDVVRQTVALQKRSPAKDTFPDRYDISAAGHIEAGGDSRDTAARELVEELGVTLAPDSLDFCFTVPAEQAGIGGCNCFEDVYVAKMDAASVDFAVGEAEVTEATWWTIAELERKLREADLTVVPRVSKYIDAFFERLERDYGYRRTA